MESLFIIALIVVAAVPLAVIYLLFSNATLRRRVSDLELAIGRQALEASAPRPVRPAAEDTPDRVATRTPWGPAVKDPAPSAPSSEPAPVIADLPEDPPKAVVFTPSKFAALIAWATENWFYVVSAISLALAGIFLVQYSIEEGLLPPAVRVALGLAFGTALIAAGEFIRRRFGDTEDASTAYLPSTFSSAGIVTLFGVILAARVLYGLIGPEVALVGMALVGVGALILGWFYGPLLAAVGVIGAILAPFFVGGSSSNPSWLFGYFGIVTTVGLAIDTVRRWAWVSVISLVLGFGAGFVVMASTPRLTEPLFMIYCAILAVLAISIPARRLVPDHGGTLLSMTFIARKGSEPWPEFPTRVAGGAVLAAVVLILLTSVEAYRADVFWTGIVTLTGLTLALLIWARNAPALTDLTALPAIGFVLVVASGSQIWSPLARQALEPEASFPTIIPALTCLALLISAAAAWRSLRGGQAQVFVALGAVLLAPATAIAMEVLWQPAQFIGAYAWALHAMAIAALMVALAERFARADGPEDRLRMSLAVLSALASIAFGMVILFSTAALTLALGVTVVAAALLDRQYTLPLMGTYILAGIATIGFRLVVDPGLEWAVEASFFDLMLSHLSAVLAFGAAYVIVKSAGRPRSEVLLESAFVSTSGILISVLLYRAIEGWGGNAAIESHWSLGIGATVWIVLGMTQLRRMSLGGTFGEVRAGLAAIFGGLAGVQLFAVATALNPALTGREPGPILGAPIVNTLLAGYLLPALALLLGALWIKDMEPRLRLGLQAVAATFAALWLTLTIRHFWRGAEMMALPGVDQPELYSYTVALLVIGAVLFYLSLARQSPLLRKAGLVVIGLAVAKVFLVDISGLGGLIRVFALLLLGLALAGLAWLNRWATGQTTPEPQDDPPAS